MATNNPDLPIPFLIEINKCLMKKTFTLMHSIYTHTSIPMHVYLSLESNN